ncbi:MAG: COX15/CtaA family protein [Candidatus Marinimicrobia bacterium]|nr:COX15/CtaA family protein [Candidatus Neomarinimicrobiota bacterium]
MNSEKKDSKSLYHWLIASLIFTYSLIFIGGLVRVSGSGMGCPDWPTCFGKLIPPTSIDQISWHPQAEFEVGDMIVHKDTLWVSDFNFTSQTTFGQENWHPYKKHNYAIFNARHTWTEYFNRLFGATTGLIITITMIFAFMHRKTYPSVFIASTVSFFLTGFEGWLGAKVVESHLASIVITLHMLFALIIVSLHMFALMKYKLSNEKVVNESYENSLPLYLKLLWVATIIEILLGTHMREGLETLAKAFPGKTDDFLMTALGAFKYIHTGLGIVLVSMTAIVWNKVMMNSEPSSRVIIFTKALVALFVFQIVMGELMVFGEFSPSFRLLHMWGASISISVIMGLYMIINKQIRKNV